MEALVSQLADQPFDVYLREHIFDPLDMPETGYDVSGNQLDRFARSCGPLLMKCWCDLQSPIIWDFGFMLTADQLHLGRG
tara:strand:- start:5 stop:244 length:240 start_codon:yes stop_codon:yes gene_type:complete